jgi:hypothetical protein
VGFAALADTEPLESWDHESGGSPLVHNPAPQVCLATYPGDAAAGFAYTSIHSWVGEHAGGHLIGEPRASGEWYKIRVQLFPDGTCGFAVDGVAVFRSHDRVPLEDDFHVVLEGRSDQTLVLVGPVAVWEGVASDVDWSSVSGR